MGGAYVLAGANHFLNPDFYIQMMPAYLPWHAFLVQLSGVAEMVLVAHEHTASLKIGA